MKKFNIMKSADSDQHVGIWYVNQDVTQSDINEAVYAVLCVVAQDVLDRSTLFVEGNYTASQLAGSFDWGGFLVMPCAENAKHLYMAPEVCVKAGEYQCNFKSEQVFSIMSEWEGVAGIKSKDVHTFYCEPHRRENIVDAKIKPYKRSCVLNPSNVSVKNENARIAKKFEVIGPMSEALGHEGMKRALAVLTAVKSIGKLYGHDMQDIASCLLRKKLWNDYGHCEMLERQKEWLKSEGERLRQEGNGKSDQYKKLEKELNDIVGRIPILKQPMCYGAKDFQCAPEVWKQVDEDYVKELMDYFKKVLADNKKPEWPIKDEMVQMRNQNTAPKKWQGKLKVCNVFGMLDRFGEKINWYAEVCTTKGKWDSMNREIGWFEKWVEPEKPSKKAVSKKEKVEKKAPAKHQPAEKHAAPVMTIEDRLRAALRKQLGVAA